jgi:lipopolysaccharide export system protein LptA
MPSTLTPKILQLLLPRLMPRRRQWPVHVAAFQPLASVLTLALVVVTGVLVAADPASAERADRGKPMSIDADAARVDGARQISTFTGNVLITKGTIVLRAAQVEVRQSPDGQQSAIALGTREAPAKFRQKRDGVDETIEGEAQRIEYDTRADTLRFVDGAVLRRFRGTQLADEAAGSLITFDNGASVFSVSGASPGGNGRVRATLTPREVPVAPSAPPAPGTAPAVPAR